MELHYNSFKCGYSGGTGDAMSKYYWEPAANTTLAGTYCTTATYEFTSSAVSTYYDNLSVTKYLTIDRTDWYAIKNSVGTFGFATTPETEEQKAARLEMERKYAEEVRLADRKARRLLVRVAGIDMYRQLKRNGHIDIVGKSAQRYRLAVGQKVAVMKGCFGDQIIHKLCAYVPDVPQVDTLVAQYLALSSGREGEEEFAKIAIKHAA